MHCIFEYCHLDLKTYGKWWGKENECNAPYARQKYILDRLSVGENMVVTSCGLHLMEEKSYLGTSPDGLVTCTSVDTLCNGC